MNENTNTLQGILDITPPSTPWQYTWESNALSILLGSLLVITLLSIILHIIWRRYFSPRGKAQHKIKLLKKQHRTQNINNRHAAFQLSRILRDALNVTQLSSRTALPEKLQQHKNRWQAFIESLSVVRYSDTDNSQQEIIKLIDDANFWLNSWPRKTHD